MPAPISSEDRDLLSRVVVWCDSHEADEIEFRKVPERPFRDMLARGFALSDKQRDWVRGVVERLFDEPIAANLFSAGRVPRGESLATPIPEVLRRPLPKKPPGRTA